MLFASSRSAESPHLERRRSISREQTVAPDDPLAGIPSAPASVREALDCLTEVSVRLRSQGDPRAAFTDVYAIITRRVRDAIDDEATCPFVEPEFISRLAGRFCTLYLAALRRSLQGSPEPSHAWSIAHRKDRCARLLPVQHAMLGLNAHINYDLAHGLFGNVGSLGGSQDAATMVRYRHDHDAVNQILQDAMPEVLELLASRYGCATAHLVLRAGQLRHALCSATIFTLRVWRTRVWRDLLAMIAAPDEAARARIDSRMNVRSGLFAMVLALPVPALPAVLALRSFGVA